MNKTTYMTTVDRETENTMEISFTGNASEYFNAINDQISRMEVGDTIFIHNFGGDLDFTLDMMVDEDGDFRFWLVEGRDDVFETDYYPDYKTKEGQIQIECELRMALDVVEEMYNMHNNEA